MGELEGSKQSKHSIDSEGAWEWVHGEASQAQARGPGVLPPGPTQGVAALKLLQTLLLLSLQLLSAFSPQGGRLQLLPHPRSFPELEGELHPPTGELVALLQPALQALDGPVCLLEAGLPLLVCLQTWKPLLIVMSPPFSAAKSIAHLWLPIYLFTMCSARARQADFKFSYS
jgi:hypothetical protein